MKEGKEYMKPPEPHMCVMTMITVSHVEINYLDSITNIILMTGKQSNSAPSSKSGKRKERVHFISVKLG